jgi:hypothetical protein
MSLTDLALLDGMRPLPLWDVIGLTLTLTFITNRYITVKIHFLKQERLCFYNGGPILF